MLKKTDSFGIDINLRDFPDDLFNLIITLLDRKNYIKKHKARMTMVKMGKSIIPQMHKLLASRNGLLRKEAVKIVTLNADRKSIPFLIKLLDDTEFDIRWMAAEGLIKIGRRSILPLMKSIRDGNISNFINNGAHHVLIGLLHENEKNKLILLLNSLKNYYLFGESAPVEASRALKTVFKYNA